MDNGTESSIKGWLHLKMARCRATALPGFDNSYKASSTNGVTFSAIDAKRADKKFYDLTYEELDKGEIVNKSGAATVDWD